MLNPEEGQGHFPASRSVAIHPTLKVIIVGSVQHGTLCCSSDIKGEIIWTVRTHQ
jgi:hypothetical protein